VMESVVAMTKGGDGGPAIVPGKAEESLLFLRASHRRDDPMPPVGNDAGARPLTPAELGLLAVWIDQGARGDATMAATVATVWRRLPAGTGPALAVALAPDGDLVAAGRAGRLAVFDTATSARLADLVDPSLASGTAAGAATPAHADVVRALAFDPRGEWLASGGYREVKLWRRRRAFASLAAPPAPAAPSDAAKAELVAIVEQARAAAARLAGGPAERAAAVAKQGLAFEEERRAAAVKEAAANGKAVEAARTARASAAQEVVAAEAKRNAAEAALAEVRQAIALPDAAAKADASAAVATPGAATPRDNAGDKAAADGERKKRLDEATKGAAAAEEELRKRRDIDRSAARVLDVAEAGATQAGADLAACEKAVASMQDALAAADAVVAEWAKQGAARPPIVAAAASADGGLVAGLEADGTLHLATRAGRPLATLVPPAGVPRAGYDGVSFAAADASAEARVVVRRGDGGGGSWPIAEQWALERTIGGAADAATLPGFVSALAFSPDGRLLAVGCGEPARPGAVVLCAVLSGAAPAGAVLSGAAPAGAVLSGVAPAGAVLSNAAPAGAVLSGAAPAGAVLSGAAPAGAVPAGTVVTRLEGSHGDEPLGVAFEPAFTAAGGRLATVAADRTLRLFAVGAATPPRLFEGHTQQVLGVAWQAHGRRLATAAADGTVKIWDVPESKQERSVGDNGREATAVRFLAAGTDLLVGSSKGLRIVNAADGKTLRTCPAETGHVHAVDASADGGLAAAAAADGRVHLWATDGKSPPRVIEP